jgi:hypothetical protein
MWLSCHDWVMWLLNYVLFQLVSGLDIGDYCFQFTLTSHGTKLIILLNTFETIPSTLFVMELYSLLSDSMVLYQLYISIYILHGLSQTYIHDLSQWFNGSL